MYLDTRDDMGVDSSWGAGGVTHHGKNHSGKNALNGLIYPDLYSKVIFK